MKFDNNPAWLKEDTRKKNNKAAGWYPEPRYGVGERYWDGQRWTENVIVHGQQYISPVASSSKGMAITALVLGILSVFLPALFALFVGAAAMTFGGISIRRAKAYNEGRAMAIVGCVLGGLAFTYALVVLF